MTETPSATTAVDHARALLCLQLHAGEPPLGDRPSTEELALLSEGRLQLQLGHRRYQEILSHLNADQKLLAEWLNIVETQTEAVITSEPARSRNGFRRWLPLPLLTLAASTGVLLLVMFGISQMADRSISPSAPHTPSTYADYDAKDLAPSMTKGALTALRRLNTLEQQELLGDLELPQEADGAHHPHAYRYGELLADAKRECNAQGSLTEATHTNVQQLRAALALPANPINCAFIGREWRALLKLSR